jgi:acetolactate synthase I/II/III large subunit
MTQDIPMKMDTTRTGATEIAAALQQLGIDRVFSLCSDQTNSIFDALIGKGIEIIGTRHESSAVHMAEGWTRATGQAAVAVIGGGPGFVNGVTGIAVAHYAAAPVIVIAGQPPLHTRERNGHQILYQAELVRSITKWSQEVTHPDIVTEFIVRGFRIATSGKPGPVCLSFPTDVLEGPVAPSASSYRVQPVGRMDDGVAVDRRGADAATDLLNRAARPVMIVGGSAWGALEPSVLAAHAQRLGMPVFTFETARGLLPDDGVICFGYAHPQYNRVFHQLASADLILLVGAEINLHTGEHKRLQLIGRDTRIVQIHPDPRQIGICRPSDAGIVGPLAAGLHALASGHDTAARERQRPWLDHIRGKYAEWRSELGALQQKYSRSDAIHPLQVHSSLARHYSESVRLSIDGGDFSHWARVFFQAKAPGHWLDKTELGNIGVSLPVGTGAQIARPAQQTWVLMGDGGFGFHGFDLSTAVDLDLPLKVVVGNDNCWGVERRLQLAHYGRTAATDLPDVRYDRIGQELGARSLYVSDPKHLDSAVDELVAAPGPVVLNVAMQRDAGRLRLD